MRLAKSTTDAQLAGELYKWAADLIQKANDVETTKDDNKKR